MVFRDRTEAGQVLAEDLLMYGNRPDVMVLALPRGGVPVAFEVAKSLNVPLDVFIVRKLGVPGHEELAMGAIANGGVRYVNWSVVDELHIPREMISFVSSNEELEVQRREEAYRAGRSPLQVHGKTVILVDDGLATGSTMRAAISALRQSEAVRIVVAVPVGAPEVCRHISREADELICSTEAEPFVAVSQWYMEFEQTTDDEVRELLERSCQTPPTSDGHR